MQIAINIVITFILYLLISYGFSNIYRAVRFFHIFYAGTIVLAAYVLFFLAVQLQLSFIIAAILSIVFGVILVLIVNTTLYKPLKKREIKSWQLLIVSLGLYIVIQNMISIIWGNSTLSLKFWPLRSSYEIFEAYITNVQVIMILIGLLVMSTSWLFLEKTIIGKKIKAVSDNNDLGQILGISSKQVIGWSFAVGSTLAATAGILIAADQGMTPTMGFDWLLYGVIAMIIGGVGRMRHLIFGAFLLASSQHLVAYFISIKWMNATAFIILIVLLYFRPYGLSGQKLKKSEI